MAGSDYIDDLYCEVFTAAKKLGVSQSVADDMARMVGDGMGRRYAGQRIYVSIPGRDERDTRLFVDRMGGMSVKQLMKKYGLSQSKVYQVISCVKCK